MQRLIERYNWDIKNKNNNNDSLNIYNNKNNHKNNNNDNRLSGYDALFSNIIACISVGDIMRSLLGPKSRDKLIINQFGEIIITNDGVTVMKSMNLEHPAAKMMVELSISMDNQNGDGTTSVVLLASFLLRKALRLIQGGGTSLSTNHLITSAMHPIRIIHSFMKASEITLNTIKDMSIDFTVDSEFGKEILMKTAKTTLNSKLISQLSPTLVNLAVDSVLMAKNRFGDSLSTQSISICGVTGGLQEDSYISSCLIKDFSFLNQLYEQQSTTKKTHKLLLFSFSFSKPKLTSSATEIEYSSNINVNMYDLLKDEESAIRSVVVALRRAGVTIIGMEEQLDNKQSSSISNLALSYFTKARISVLKPFSRSQLKNFANDIGAYIFNSPQELKEKNIDDKLVEFNSIQQKKIGNESLLFFEPKNSNLVSPTIVLMGTTDIELEESKRALHDSLCVLRNLVRTPSVVPGGGACEAEAALQLTKVAKQLSSPQEVSALLVFAESLEEIPETLCFNAGLNHLQMLKLLRSSHQQEQQQQCTSDMKSKNRYNGVDLQNGEITNMYEKGILETTTNKLSQISMATEIVVSILKIDEIIYYKK